MVRAETRSEVLGSPDAGQVGQMQLWRSFHSSFYSQRAAEFAAQFAHLLIWSLPARGVVPQGEIAGNDTDDWVRQQALRYSGSIMKESFEPKPIDPVGLTRALCEIESTTYNEGPVGDFLADFLAGRRWAVEKTPVAQPAESTIGGARWNVFAGVAGQTPDLVFSTHMDTVP